MSDHGSLTASFRVALVRAQAWEGDGDAAAEETTAAAAAVASAGDPIGQSGGFITVSDREARAVDRTETRDWAGGDDGHYGLR